MPFENLKKESAILGGLAQNFKMPDGFKFHFNHMNSSPLINQLIESLNAPGVGPKSAQRMTLFLLERIERRIETSESLVQLWLQCGNCRECRNLTEHELCSFAKTSRRSKPMLCC